MTFRPFTPMYIVYGLICIGIIVGLTKCGGGGW